MLRLYRYITDSTLRTLTGLSMLALLAGFGLHLTHAATSYDPTNEVQMFLDASITSTQTTGIIASSPQLNGANFTFATTTGGIIRIRSGAYREDFYYSSASVSSSTNKVTFSGVVRGICPQYARLIISCGLGRNWGKSAIMEVTVDARILNLKANIDRANTFGAPQSFGSGIILTGSGYGMQPNSLTTTERNAMTNVKNGTMIWNETVGTNQFYGGGSWYSFGSGGLAINATTLVRGVDELATVADQILKTATGDSGAPLVLQAQHLTQSGSQHVWNNTYQAGRVPILNASGALSVTLGGLGTGNLGSGSILISQGSGAVKAVRANLSLSGSLTVISSTSGSTFKACYGATCYFDVKGVQHNGHVLTGGSTPTVAGCGTSPSIVGNDTAGRISVGAGTVTSCAMYFNKRPNRVSCVISPQSERQTFFNVTPTASGITIAAADFGSILINYHCLEY